MAVCEFCRSEIDDAALICPQCRKRTGIGRTKARESVFTKAFLTVVGVLVLIVIANVVAPVKRLPETHQGCLREAISLPR